MLAPDLDVDIAGVVVPAGREVPAVDRCSSHRRAIPRTCPDTVATMGARTYPSGVPCWIDIEPADADSAQRFYGGLFGWTFSDAMPPGAPGYYLIAQLDGVDVGAIARREPVSTGAWNTYVAVDDVDAVTRSAATAGGTVTSPAQDAGPAGRWAEIVDPTGGRVRLWQAGRRLGGQVTNAPGAWNFSDLHTTDPVGGASLLRPAVRLGGRRDGRRAGDVASSWVRRPPRLDDRPRHPRAAGGGLRAARLR